VSVTGATQIRAGGFAGIIAPRTRAESPIPPDAVASAEEGLNAGSLIRVIRQPYFGHLGRYRAPPS